MHEYVFIIMYLIQISAASQHLGIFSCWGFSKLVEMFLKVSNSVKNCKKFCRFESIIWQKQGGRFPRIAGSLSFMQYGLKLASVSAVGVTPGYGGLCGTITEWAPASY